jgi:hypothetical protein
LYQRGKCRRKEFIKKKKKKTTRNTIASSQTRLGGDTQLRLKMERMTIEDVIKRARKLGREQGPKREQIREKEKKNM